MASGEEIQKALRAFVGKWSGYSGSERAEAQTFLNELFAAFGSDRRAVGAEFEFWAPQAGFMDLHWPEICLIEMKAPGRPVTTAHLQVKRYRDASSNFDIGQRAARWVVICNFVEFEIWQPGDFPTRPVASFTLDELPDRFDALAFLAGPAIEPSFVEHNKELTKVAAAKVAEVFHALMDRSAAPGETIRWFILQSVWCMFAEDLRMLDDFPYDATLRSVRQHPVDSAAKIGHLFNVLNQKSDHNRTGPLAGTRYVNGELFAQPAAIQLTTSEIDLLIEAGTFDWTKVDPTIFGSLLEGLLGKEKRWELGAHYTHEVDIMKIVGPTIVRPWRERIEATTSPTEARALLDELCRFRVLDPACGCGNFLYIAYRELRGLEHALKSRIGMHAQEQGLPAPEGPWPYYPLANLQGIDIEPSAVMVARVTLWMGHRQMIEVYGEAEAPLPLQSLDGVRRADALRLPWPETDCIIGNPPFLGSQHVRGALGDDYVDFLKTEFRAGVKDLCTYWFRRAADHLQPGQRAGLVGTNSITQNRGRSASLDYVLSTGGEITDAVSSQKWPGEAKVHVSIVNWVDEPGESVGICLLDGVEVPGISSSLGVARSTGWTPQALAANLDRCFQGPIPVGKGFIVMPDTAMTLRQSSSSYDQVVRPYLTAADITDDPMQRPSRWIIDFGQMRLEEASRFPEATAIVRRDVRPFRETVNRRGHREKWWLFGEPRVGMRNALKGKRRFGVVAAHAKRLNLAVVDAEVLPSNACMVFAFDDAYSYGILISRAHEAWAWEQSSTLKADLRYTPTSVFATFAWPDRANAQSEHVSDAAQRLLARRGEICTTEQIGLTTLYNQVDDGAWADLKALHKELDEAVVACYGWPRSVAQDDPELVRRLLDLNREIIEGERDYNPFA